MREVPPIKKMIIPGLFVLSLFIMQWSRSGNKVPKWKIQGEIMGTTYTVQVIDLRAPDKGKIHEVLEGVNQKMSTYQPSSELSRFNQHKDKTPFKISDSLRAVLIAAQEISQASEGAFDVTVGPLVNAWGFGPEGRRKTPTPEELKSLKASVGYQHLSLSPEGAIKMIPNLYCDLSAIAKGYAVDEVARLLDLQKYNNYWVEVGGEVRVKGVNADGVPWRVGIERPAGEGEKVRRRMIYRVISLKEASVATSGDYRNRYVDHQGIVRSHTIDPRTARPVTHSLASVSVIHPENMYADAWATALNVLGAKEGFKVAQKHKIAAFFILRVDQDQAEGQANQSPKDEKFTHLLSDAMKSYLE